MFGETWLPVRDGDPRATALYNRHYSAARRSSPCATFTGNGESLVLLTPDCQALFAWRYQRLNDARQYGVNCSVFRNEGPHRSSDLILAAEEWAWERWPAQKRLFTYVNPKQVKSQNPGYCFLMAGWRRCGYSKKGLLILEKCESPTL